MFRFIPACAGNAEALEVPSPEFRALYAKVGRPSIPPETLPRALLLQAVHTTRSERRLMEQLDDNLLFRRFVGLSMDAPVWGCAGVGRHRVHQEPRASADGRCRG